ncbi:hypothetical protein KPH14_006456 [Odynerus spinipes]|uniref:dolichyl-P-Man:Man5GlcNAc2-PP-dolichol alpha-1,3-mannosyltransferase n=1 Tax=Odynerus spinipes TaxID=1348599 RepID=A0AAD9VS24_9HYME|nr:hypothetical protein KPH14_006456 [Odynerus spinipes]
MAPRKESRSNHNINKASKRSKDNWIKNYFEWRQFWSLLTDPRKIALTANLFILLEIILNVFIIEKVPYTEIDWKAYMQEVEGFLNGTLDYSKLKGDTGPLVYPAGFLYIFSALYYITAHGTQIKIAQYVFAVLYIALLALVFRIYSKTKKVPPYVLILMCCTSYRIHSIFVLRLFNDPIAMILLFSSLNAFLDERWYLGSILYSLAVSVKMNILLFAPALLVAYLCILGKLKTVIHLFICAVIQVILGLPFLLHNPIAYIKGAFNLGRVFEFKWTVNWRFLPEEIFVNPYFHISLLLLHLLLIAISVPNWIVYMRSYAKLKQMEKDLKPQFRKQEKVDMSTMSQLFVLPLFVANFIGIVCSRSLHYQFYIWYYHTLPYIAWCTSYKTTVRLMILGIIELCWNTYPMKNTYINLYIKLRKTVCGVVQIFILLNCATYKTQLVGIDDEPSDTKCLLCKESYVLPTNEKEFLTHLFKEHRLVIGDVRKIASLKSYVHYWSIQFKEQPLTNFCTTLLMDCTPDGKPSKNESYFLLSDCISEDKTLRDEIHRVKLEWVLAKQSEERSNTNFKRGCMFCRMEFSESRVTYIKHLSQKHNLYLGKPENLVFIDELLDKIQQTIESLICIYCEKIFKDRIALKEHMRKKLHKRINPHNKTFDKFYINNYLEPGRTWRQQVTSNYKCAKDTELSSESEDEESSWSDWNDESISILCLFCKHTDKDFVAILQHIKEKHNFDFEKASKDLTFYQKVKLVNYIRRQIHLQCCILCEEKSDNVLEHMFQENHCKVPKQRIWDQPEFYFPMNENDSFLYNLDADNDHSEESDIENTFKDLSVTSN